eukprot:2057557-Pleurochrysis_carterae.AAC.1
MARVYHNERLAQNLQNEMLSLDGKSCLGSFSAKSELAGRNGSGSHMDGMDCGARVGEKHGKREESGRQPVDAKHLCGCSDFRCAEAKSAGCLCPKADQNNYWPMMQQWHLELVGHPTLLEECIESLVADQQQKAYHQTVQQVKNKSRY